MLSAGAFAEQVAALTGLSAKVQRALTCCLCQAATGLPDDGQRDQYIGHLLHNVAGQFRGLTVLHPVHGCLCCDWSTARKICVWLPVLAPTVSPTLESANNFPAGALTV